METTAQSTEKKMAKPAGRKAGGVKKMSKVKSGDVFFKVGSGRRSAIENLIIANRKWDFATKQKALKFFAKLNG